MTSHRGKTRGGPREKGPAVDATLILFLWSQPPSLGFMLSTLADGLELLLWTLFHPIQTSLSPGLTPNTLLANASVIRTPEQRVRWPLAPLPSPGFPKPLTCWGTLVARLTSLTNGRGGRKRKLWTEHPYSHHLCTYMMEPN